MDKIQPRVCPVCGIQTSYVYRIQDQHGNESVWYRCANGVIFQSELPDYLKEDRSLDMPMEQGDVDIGLGVDLQKVHAAYLYSPLIENICFGRFALQVGFLRNADVLKYLMDRGWIVWGIDDRDFEASGNLYKGDFKTYDFSIDTDNPAIEAQLGEDAQLDRKFDLVWIEHYLERTADPVGVLKKAYDVLSDTGVLYLAIPDFSFINQRGIAGWNYWDKKVNYIFWEKKAIVRELEKLGFEVIVCRRNFQSRTYDWDDMHIVAQKKYY